MRIRNPARPFSASAVTMHIPPYPADQPPGFTAASLDRQGHWRQEPEQLAKQLETAGIILVHRYKMPIQGRHIHLLPARDFTDQLDAAIWLGMWQERSIYALDISAQEPAQWPELDFSDLRGAAMRLQADDASVLAYARAMIYWQRQHRYCGRCGTATSAGLAGHVRRCPQCEVEHYPRTDPSMLVLVSDGSGRCLLGRQASWGKGFWSVLAGFVEPGEGIEDAVVREVWEEARIRVTGMRYIASQAWPFPASVLLGFHALGIADPPQVDQDELEAAAWFSREDIRNGIAAGSLLVPPPFTLSYRLLEEWFDLDSPVPLGDCVKGRYADRS